MASGASNTQDVARLEDTRPTCSEHRQKPDIPSTGMTVLSSGGHDPVADVVFVHGLQGHPETTWTYRNKAPKARTDSSHVERDQQVKKQAGLKSLMNKMKFFHKKDKNKQEASAQYGVTQGETVTPVPAVRETSASTSADVFWPLDLLSEDIPGVRVLTFGYDSNVSNFFQGSTNRNSISAHGIDLVDGLLNERTKEAEIDRPIIFVAHSLGGLVVKAALRRSRDSADNAPLHAIFEQTQCIMFYGTPHRGAQGYAEWGMIAHNIVSAVGFDANSKLLRELKEPDSEMLELLREDFSKMLKANSFNVHSFREGRGYKGTSVAGLAEKVVQPNSATLDDAREEKHNIDANHVNMVRFSGQGDAGYKTTIRVLRNAVKVCSETMSAQHRKCLSSLRVASIDLASHQSRYRQIHPKYGATLEWIFTEDQKHNFCTWLERHRGLYWMRGLPGSGKSTAMKFIFDDERTKAALPSGHTEPIWIMIGVFFHGRGAEVQKTFAGMLRSVLYQLLRKAKPYPERRRLFDIISPIGRRVEDSQNGSDALEFHWSDQSLQEALKAVIDDPHLRLNILLLVDALDEHQGDTRKMAEYLREVSAEGLMTSVRIKVLVASRDENDIRAELESHMEFKPMDIHKLTEPDIGTFVRGKLTDSPQMQSWLSSRRSRARAQELIDTIVKKAQGVFLWVRLVVNDILGELDKGTYTVTYLFEFLGKVPGELDAYYRQILTKIKKQDKAEAFIFFELVLRASRPWTVVELAHLEEHANQMIRSRGPYVGYVDSDGNLEAKRQAKAHWKEVHEGCLAVEKRIRQLCRGLIQIHSPDPRSFDLLYGFDSDQDMDRLFIKESSTGDLDPSEQTHSNAPITANEAMSEQLTRDGEPLTGRSPP